MTLGNTQRANMCSARDLFVQAVCVEMEVYLGVTKILRGPELALKSCCHPRESYWSLTPTTFTCDYCGFSCEVDHNITVPREDATDEENAAQTDRIEKVVSEFLSPRS